MHSHIKTETRINYDAGLVADRESTPLFEHIKQKILIFLKPREALKHVRDELDSDTLIELHTILYHILKKINEVEQERQTSLQEEEIIEDTFLNALDKIASLIQAIRDQAATIITNQKSKTNLDLYLQALQLHLQNFDYYQSIGIDFFNDESSTGIPSNLFANIGYPWFTSQPSDYVSFASSPPVTEPAYITPEIINEIKEFSLVYVTVTAPNPHGHILLGLGDMGYIHVNSLNDRPQYISTDKFNEYLRKSIHMVLGVQQIYVPDREAAKAKLLELSNQPWLWLMYRHNCNNFADAVLHAGGIPYAHIDPLHIGKYHHHTQYPVKRLTCVHPDSLNKPSYDSLPLEEKANLKNHHEDASLQEKYIQLGKNAGFNDEKAEVYAHYRIDEGLSHKRAQYKVEPSFINFLAMHHNKIKCAAILHPLLFVLAAPFLFITSVKSLAFNVNCLFSHADKQKENKHAEHPLQGESEAPSMSEKEPSLKMS